MYWSVSNSAGRWRVWHSLVALTREQAGGGLFYGMLRFGMGCVKEMGVGLHDSFVWCSLALARSLAPSSW